MDLVGTIRLGDGATAERNTWVALIYAHSFLAPVAPRQGVNPFTKKASYISGTRRICYDHPNGAET